MSAPTVVTSATPKPSSGVSSGIRIVLAIVVSIPLALFTLVWNAGFIPTSGIPIWIGNLIFMPLAAVAFSFGADCLIQQLSCSQVEWLVQLQRAAIVPVPFLLMWLILRFLPILRWPIEGTIQHLTPTSRNAISSAFYVFWISMYSQGLLNSLSQVCPT